MANQSAKKRERENAVFFKNLFLAIGISWVLYGSVRLFWYWEDVSASTWMCVFIHLMIDLYMIWMFKSLSLESNLGGDKRTPFQEYHLDVHYINTAIKGLSVFSGWFFLLFLSIPGYLLYMFATGAFSNPNADDMMLDEDPKRKRRREKKEKRMRYR
eukprot:TRINITY_DN12733_c0_g1_i1.p1 TRINITY_DN12733_c0_g1~~TRINITY_DN12733_c0_g1_i1.p1  ORF type:complete len:157 (-),score=39.00 TRINITY_DN12733_c0_g1_i1:12-482(-)